MFFPSKCWTNKNFFVQSASEKENWISISLFSIFLFYCFPLRPSLGTTSSGMNALIGLVVAAVCGPAKCSACFSSFHFISDLLSSKSNLDSVCERMSLPTCTLWALEFFSRHFRWNCWCQKYFLFSKYVCASRLFFENKNETFLLFSLRGRFNWEFRTQILPRQSFLVPIQHSSSESGSGEAFRGSKSTINH